MAKKNNQTMPSSMLNDIAERQARENVEKCLEALRRQVKRCKELGAQIVTADDLYQFTPDFVRQGIEAQRAKHLQGQFIPQAIRQTWTQEFNRMEIQLVPAASELQEILSSLKWGVILIDDQIDFCGAEVEAWIEQQATVTIPEPIRALYSRVTAICEDWQALINWCAENGLKMPSMRLIRQLSHEGKYANVASEISDQDVCTLSLSPDEMFSLYLFGIVGQQQADK